MSKRCAYCDKSGLSSKFCSPLCEHAYDRLKELRRYKRLSKLAESPSSVPRMVEPFHSVLWLKKAKASQSRLDERARVVQSGMSGTDELGVAGRRYAI